MPKLSDVRHEIFAQRFVANGFNSVAAARAAGYSGNPTQAAALRRRSDVEERIRELLADQMAELQVDALSVKRELVKIAFADPRGLFDDHGNLIPIKDLDDDTAATISGIEVEVKRDRDGNQISEVVKIKRYSKLDALVFLGKHFKLVGDDNDGVNAFANALADRLNAAKRRVAGQAVTEVLGTVPGTPPASAVLEATDAQIIEPQPVPVRAEEAQPSQGESRDQLW